MLTLGVLLLRSCMGVIAYTWGLVGGCLLTLGVLWGADCLPLGSSGGLVAYAWGLVGQQTLWQPRGSMTVSYRCYIHSATEQTMNAVTYCRKSSALEATAFRENCAVAASPVNLKERCLNEDSSFCVPGSKPANQTCYLTDHVLEEFRTPWTCEVPGFCLCCSRFCFIGLVSACKQCDCERGQLL